MHRTYQGTDIIDRRFRQDTVAEVENEAGVITQFFENSTCFFDDHFRASKEKVRVKISLKGLRCKYSSGVRKRNTPIETDNVNIEFSYLLEQVI